MIPGKRGTIFLLALLCGQLSCSLVTGLPAYEDLSKSAAYTVLHFPDTHFEDILWRYDGVLVVMRRDPDRISRQQYAFQGDDTVRTLDLPLDGECLVTYYRLPISLPDGRMGLIKDCVTDSAFTSANYLVAYDWKTGQLEQIVRNPLRDYDGCFSYNPDMTTGLQLVGDGLVGTLNWLTREGPEPVNITLRDGNREWNLADSYEENGSLEGGTISCPDWSPKGDKIAVFVSFDAMGVEWIPRLDKPSKLVLISHLTQPVEQD
jgi:hypothetical protein